MSENDPLGGWFTKLEERIDTLLDPKSLATAGGKAAARGIFKAGKKVGQMGSNATMRRIESIYKRLRERIQASEADVDENRIGAALGSAVYRGIETFRGLVERSVDYLVPDQEEPGVLSELQFTYSIFLEYLTNAQERVSEKLEEADYSHAIHKSPQDGVRVAITFGPRTYELASHDCAPKAKEKDLIALLDDFNYLFHDASQRLAQREMFAGKKVDLKGELPSQNNRGILRQQVTYGYAFSVDHSTLMLEYRPLTGRGLTLKLADRQEEEPCQNEVSPKP